MRLWLPASLVGSLLACALAGCTGGDEQAAERPAPELGELPAVWESDAVREVGRGWVVGDDLVVASDTDLASLALDTGDPSWQLDLPGRVCAWADAPNDDGLLAVLLDAPRTEPRRCLDVAAIDLTTGEVAWQRAVSHPIDYDRAEYDGIGAGRDVVAVVDSTFGVVGRLASVDGRYTDGAPVEPDDERPRVSVTEDRLVSVRYRDQDRVRRVTVEDVDTGEMVASYLAGDTAEARMTVEDPLVLATTRGSWGNELLVGEQGVPTGRGPGEYVEVHDDLLISDPGGVLFAHDLVGGEERWAVPLGLYPEVAGVTDDAVIVTSTAPYWLGGETDTVVERVPLDGAEPQALGTVGAGGALALVGDVLLRATADGVVAHRLPPAGPEVADFVEALDWTEGDLRPREVLDACTAVSGRTLARFGLAADERVAGACAWGGGQNVIVRVEAHAPTEARSAEEQARAVTESSLPRDEVAGIGDEAWIDPSDPWVTARVGNVVIEVRSTTEGLPAARVRGAAVSAAEEVVAALEEIS